MSKRVLVVDDEELLCKVHALSLGNKGFSVEVARDGQAAVEILQDQDFDLVLSDHQMPRMNGLQLFDWITKNKPGTPFIMMTGFSEISDEKQALEKGMSGFIAKPFSKKSLLSLVNEVLGLQGEPAREQDPEALYSKVPIDNFLVGFEIPYRIYISLGKKKYLKVAHTGDSLEESRIQTYKSKGVEYLYLHKEDFSEFVGFTLKAMGEQVDKSEINKRRKAQIMTGVSQVLFEKVMADGLDDQTYKMAMEMTELTLRTSIEDEAVMNMVDRMKDASLSLFEHSLFVSAYSVILAKALGHLEMRDLFSVSLGGFFHDVGKTHMSKEMHDMKPAEFDEEQKEQHRRHPEAGMKILEKIEAVPAEVLDIVLQHEDAMMTLAVKRSDAKVSLPHIVCIANKICNILPEIAPGPNRFKETIDQLFAVENNIDEELIEILGDLSKLSVVDEAS